MSTVTMNISVPEDLKSFVDARMQAKGFSSVSEYMRDLVRRDIERRDEERFVALIEEGLKSPIDPRPWSEIEKQMRSKIAAHTSGRKKSKAIS
jgi:antitoxin ParD1/3/4